MTAAVTREQRHTKAHRCPICDGADGDPRGKSKRCSGFATSDGAYVHCSREEFAGSIAASGAGLFVHWMQGECRCGVTHGTSARSESDIETIYEYRDEQGALAMQVLRLFGKRFRQRAPDGAGGFVWSTKGVRLVPYRLPELLAADPSDLVFIVEGERDVETLRGIGLVATTNPQGAGKWASVATVASAALKGRDVVVIADADDVGRSHARNVRASLLGDAKSVRVIEPPAPHKDATDWVQAGANVPAILARVGIAANETTAARTSRLKIWTPEEIWAPLPPPEYAIAGLLLRGSLGLLSATGSSLKTWMAADMAIAVAQARPWLGRFAVEASGDATFVDWESGDYELPRRFQAISPALVPGVRMVTMPDLYLNSADFEMEIMPLASSSALLVFDSLAAGTVDIDENDARFAAGLQTLKRIGNATKCAMLVLHHNRKGGKAEAGADARDKPRGTSAIYAACDVVLSLERAGKGFLVQQTKARGGKEVAPFVVRVDDLEEGGVSVYATDKSDDADAETPVEVLVAEGSKAIAHAKKAILLLLSKDKTVTSANGVADRIKGSGGRGVQRQTALSALKELRESGLVVLREGFLRLDSEVTK